MRASGGLLQLVRQPPLPQVPGHRRGAVAGGPGRRPARHTVLPRRVHAPGGLGPIALAQPAGGLRPADAGRRGDPARGGRRPQAPRGRGRRAWRCCTPGARTSTCTRTSIASSPAAGCRPTGAVGSPAATTSSSRSASSAACSGASSSPGSAPPSSGGGSASRASWRRWPGRIGSTALLAEVVRTEWVVYAKPPFGGPRAVLKYLARYTHRAAISNHRLVDLADGRVSFRWKDYAHGGRQGTMTLKAVEFVRRFLMHVLPVGLRAGPALRAPGQPPPPGEAGAVPGVAGREHNARPVAADPRFEPKETSKDSRCRDAVPLRSRPDGDHRDLASDSGQPGERGRSLTVRIRYLITLVLGDTTSVDRGRDHP